MTTRLADPDLCVTTIRTLAIDAVQRANSGHPGAPMGLAPVAWTLFSSHLHHSPATPDWPGRDRFVLSAGHASALLYGLLHLTGYEVSLQDLRDFRTLGSATPGHPERGDTPGVEITTGPLGQGFANAVGFALAESMLGARYNRPDHTMFGHRTWFICSDGDLMEGISHEAASIAGFLGLERLIGIWDDNRISLDGPTDLAFGEDVPARLAACGWRVMHIEDGNDLEEIERVLVAASVPDGRPTLIRCRTNIGFGSPAKQDTSGAHGAPLGADEVRATKAAYGWPEDAEFLVPPEVDAWRAHMRARGLELEAGWRARMDAYEGAFPAEAAELRRVLAGDLPAGWEGAVPEADPSGSPATRASGGAVLNALAGVMPELVQGAADLASSTSTTIKGGGDVAPGSYAGRNIYYGVREHAMGAITNAIAAHGGLRPVCSTFFTFSDYMKNTLRLAALMHVGSIFVFTHDSVALGEDGPTHQPIEHLAGLRAIPGLVTLRPADAAEVAAAWTVAIARTDGPTALILSRQGVASLGGSADVARGAYVVADGQDCLLMATGAEVQVAMAAREALAAEGIGARVVSMPSWELFRAQDPAYRESVLPAGMRARVSVEAAARLGWGEWVGLDGASVGIDRFGVSAPGAQAMEHLGVTADAVADAARGLVGR
ncbi:MAG: transketolase [Miltoncostaeaceae bacterium]